MRIFLSWSGVRSKQVATALRDWLPLILHYANPWLSDKDIEAGDRWSMEIGKELEASNFGVICLTRDNLSADWILFEAGALSKALQTGSVCPYLLDVEFQDLRGPLSQFQAKKAESAQTLELVEAINSKSETPVNLVACENCLAFFGPSLNNASQRFPRLARLGRLLVLPQTYLKNWYLLCALLTPAFHSLSNSWQA